VIADAPQAARRRTIRAERRRAVLEVIQEAGPAGVDTRVLAAAFSLATGASFDSLLLGLTRECPELAEDDDGRLVWVGTGGAA